MKKAFLALSIITALTLSSCVTESVTDEDLLNNTLNEATTSFEAENYEEAEKLFSDALLIDESNEIAIKNQIITLNQLDKNEEALALSKKASTLYPDSIKFKLISARLYALLGDDENAIIQYQEILKTAGLEESYNLEYLDYLLTLDYENNDDIRTLIVERANFLLDNNIAVIEALKTLCMQDKTNIMYSLLLEKASPKQWKEIFSTED
ncbi:MAG: hypothetical protein M0P10_02495 [Sphaerochaetaceae bacterium]|nr:hypothetical protein [Sphaerochaetaceae bacterium]